LDAYRLYILAFKYNYFRIIENRSIDCFYTDFKCVPQRYFGEKNTPLKGAGGLFVVTDSKGINILL
jgi:hypothetical protein